MDTTQVVAILGNFGFPVLVAVYLLIRLEKKLDGLTGAINDLQRIMDKRKNNK